jgi:hypothetical protein
MTCKLGTLLSFAVVSILCPSGLHAEVLPPAAVEKPLEAGVVAETAPLDSGLSDAQWQAMLRNVGVETTNQLLMDFRWAVNRRVAQRGEAFTFNEYLDQRQVLWTQHRNGGIAAIAIGVASAILGGIMYHWCEVHNRTSGPNHEYSDEPAACPAAVLGSTLPIGGVLLIVGAPLVSVYQSRIDDMNRARSEGRIEGAWLRWTGIVPMADENRGTRGVSISFAF